MAIATVTWAHKAYGHIRKLTASVVFNSSTGAFDPTSQALPALIDGTLVELRTNPGSPAPTANYDISLVDADGLDRLQGVGQNRHTSNSEQAAIIFPSTSLNPHVDKTEAAVGISTLLLTITGNSVNSAQTVITIVYIPD